MTLYRWPLFNGVINFINNFAYFELKCDNLLGRISQSVLWFLVICTFVICKKNMSSIFWIKKCNIWRCLANVWMEFWGSSFQLSRSLNSHLSGVFFPWKSKFQGREKQSNLKLPLLKNFKRIENNLIRLKARKTPILMISKSKNVIFNLIDFL